MLIETTTNATLKDVRAYTSGKHIIVFDGFYDPGYADTTAFKTKVKDILEREARHAGGYGNIIVVANAQNHGIGQVHELAKQAGIATLGIALKGSQPSRYCDNVVIASDLSWMVPLASTGGAFYALGGGEGTYSRVVNAQHQQINTHAYYFMPDPAALAQKRTANQKSGKFVKSYVVVNDAILSLSPEGHPERLQAVVDMLFHGQVFVHELTPEDRQLVSRFLEDSEIEALSQRNVDGRALHNAIYVVVKKYADTAHFANIGKPALHAALDEEYQYWQELERILRPALQESARAPEEEEGRHDMPPHLSDPKQPDTPNMWDIPLDSYTQRALKARARVIYGLQAYLSPVSNVALSIGMLATISRLIIIDKQLPSSELHDDEKAELRKERILTLAELITGLGDPGTQLVARLSVLNVDIVFPDWMPAFKPDPMAFAKRATSGIAFANNALSVAGTILAWLIVDQTAHELEKEKKAADMTDKAQLARIDQLQANLSVNMMSAIVITGLTTGNVIQTVASIMARLSTKAATSLAATIAKIFGVFTSVAGPIGGVILLAAFVGLWIYNGIKTVERFSQYIKMNGWEKATLGFGAIFGYMPPSVQIEYDKQKLDESVVKLAQLETDGIFDSLPEVKAIYQFPAEIVPGRIIEHVKKTTGYFDGLEWETTQIERREFIPAKQYQGIINIDMDKKQYVAKSSDGNEVLLNPDDFIRIRKTSHKRQAENAKYRHVNNRPLLGSNEKVFFFARQSSGIKHDVLAQAGKFFHNQADTILHLSTGNVSSRVLPTRRILNVYAKPALANDSTRLIWHEHYSIGRNTRLHAALKVRFDNNELDSLLVLTSDNVFVLKEIKGKYDKLSYVPFASQEDTEALLLTLNVAQSSTRVMAVRETGYLTLFCIQESSGEISFFKYREKDDGTHQLDASLTQSFPTGLQLQDSQLAGVFFQDLSGDGLADLVVISREGQLKVALQKRNGTFVLTADDEFSIYRPKPSQNDLKNPSFSGHKILGFGTGARTLYSVDNSGALYAHTLISKKESAAMVSLVNLRIEANTSDSPSDQDIFIAPLTPDAGDFIFWLGGGRSKKVTGGVNNDSFLLLDDTTSCTLNGGAGRDILNFSQFTLQGTQITGVNINAPDGKASLILTTGAVAEKSVSFSHIENFIGTRGEDTLTGDDNDNVIDGVSGKDVINAGAGNDALMGVSGRFDGGVGIDNYRLRRMPSGSTATVELIEDYRKGEDSHVSLDYHIDEITAFAPEAEGHLLITLNGGMQYRIRDFYANQHASTDKGNKTSTWYFTTKEGFHFNLKTAQQLPASMTSLRGIPVAFHSTLTPEERGLARINLHAGNGDARDRVVISETVAGRRVTHNIHVPLFFDLELSSIAGQGEVTGSYRAEYLAGASGSSMKGNGGADTYFIQDSAGGVVTIDNNDKASSPERDTLLLPWKLSETKLSIDNHSSDILLAHASLPDSHVKVRLSNFMNNMQSRHLALRDSLGSMYHLGVTGNKAWLASSTALNLDKEDRLELLGASQGGLDLDGRYRPLSISNQSTVIVDHSGTGNSLYGTQNARNYLWASSGNNTLYGGRLNDVLYGGTGNDAYYVRGSAAITDTGGEDALILEAATGKAQDVLWFNQTSEGDLLIRFRNDDKRSVLVKGYYDNLSQKKIERIVMNGDQLSNGGINSLADVMATVSTVHDSNTAWNNPMLVNALNLWTSLTPSQT